LPLHCAPQSNNRLAPLRGRQAVLASLDGVGLDSLETLLKRWGMHCTRCHDPERLLQQLQQSPADSLLVIMTPWPGLLSNWLDTLRPKLHPNQAVLLLGSPEQLQNLPSASGLQLLDLPLPLTVSPLRTALEEIYLQSDSDDAEPCISDTTEAPCILVAEDNQVNQMVIRGLLKNGGYSSQVVDDGEQAVQFFQRNPEAVRLILMDCEMPVMDGFAATQAIRQFELQHQLKPIPIIALTAHQLDEQRQLGDQVGLSSYLNKPVDSALLYRTLERYLGKSDEPQR
jgi:CheY-like chemotaxis protein